MATGTKKFQRNIEDFTCLNCGFKVKGNGYTNHCPKCLFSRHVDINPGDRASNCQGLMWPIALENKNQEFIILHKCQNCGHEKRNRANKDDDQEAIIKLSSNT